MLELGEQEIEKLRVALKLKLSFSLGTFSNTLI
jgi:hypothetical protein